MKQEYIIKDKTSYEEMKSYLDDVDVIKKDNNFIETKDFIFRVEYKPEFKYDPFIYGVDQRENLVALEVLNDEVHLYYADGRLEKIPHQYWMITNKNYSLSTKLDGNLWYKYLSVYDTLEEYNNEKQKYYRTKKDFYKVTNLSEQAMIMGGYTLFKGLEVKDVSVLSFDIEANCLLDKSGVPVRRDDSMVFIITNTYRDRKSKLIRKSFFLDEYEDQWQMIEDWCSWVREIDPHIVVAHNGFGYDLPFLNYVWSLKNPSTLPLGKPEKPNIEIEEFTRKFRKDGSQDYDYHDIKIFGRQVIDTMFLAIKYDFARNYVSYGLKQIIKQEGLEKEGRQHYDASKIAEHWENPEERAKIKQYAEEDSDDSLKLFDLMIPSFFYYTQSIPKTLQQINNSATGAQVNSFLVRSYLQEGHSIPNSSEKTEFEGAISFGNPGLYKHVLKVDVASLYPSIIRQYKVYDKEKDPKKHFLKMVEHFTNDRLNNKKLAKETGHRKYKDLEQSQKIFINSSYGLLGSTGLNFNSPQNGAMVTRHGREILQKGIDWVKENNYILVNVDTDSFSYSKDKDISKEEFKKDIEEINSMYPDGIRWEDDGYFPRVLILKAKNYILDDGQTIKFKGSSITDTKREKALREMLKEMIEVILDEAN